VEVCAGGLDKNVSSTDVKALASSYNEKKIWGAKNLIDAYITSGTFAQADMV
jgi:hypothetical protein